MEPDGGFKDAKKLIHHTRGMVSILLTLNAWDGMAGGKRMALISGNSMLLVKIALWRCNSPMSLHFRLLEGWLVGET